MDSVEGRWYREKPHWTYLLCWDVYGEKVPFIISTIHGYMLTECIVKYTELNYILWIYFISTVEGALFLSPEALCYLPEANNVTAMESDSDG